MDFVVFSQSSELTAFAEHLLEEAFPVEERPLFNTILKRDKDIYHLCVAENEGTMLGIMAYWSFDELIYIEHFAVCNELRNRGIGGVILDKFLSLQPNGTQVVLEAELPDSALAKRRVDFYRRHGFTANTFEYLQPPYHAGGDPLPMVLLSLKPLDKNDFEKIRDTLYNNVYGRN